MPNLQEDINRKIDEAVQSGSDSLIIEGYGHRQYPITLPENLADATNLRHIEFLDLTISNIEIILNLTSLETLKIEEIDGIAPLIENMYQLKNLRKLDIDCWDFPPGLPDNWEELDKLKELRIQWTEFDHFPEVIGELTALESFQYEKGACITHEAFEILKKLPNLKNLGLVDMHLPESIAFNEDQDIDYIFPENISHLHKLEHLNLADNIYIKSLPETLGRLDNLRSLKLYNSDYDTWESQFSSLPETIGKLGKLEELDLYGLTRLEVLPETVQELNNLKRLDLGRTSVESPNLTPSQLGKLEFLGANNPFIYLEKCASLKELDCYFGTCGFTVDGKSISSPPNSIGEDDLRPLCALHTLEKLYMVGRHLASTEFLTQLINLKKLNLSCNFSSFPANIANLQNLEELDLFGAADLTDLPEFLGLIPSLKIINCQWCGISAPPAWLKYRPDIKINIRNPFKAS